MSWDNIDGMKWDNLQVNQCLELTHIHSRRKYLVMVKRINNNIISFWFASMSNQFWSMK